MAKSRAAALTFRQGTRAVGTRPRGRHDSRACAQHETVPASGTGFVSTPGIPRPRIEARAVSGTNAKATI